MAQIKKRRAENVSGNFYVDSTCIDCDTCRWMAPDTFHRDGEMSAVHRQPQNQEDKIRALQALLSCPTTSIGTVEKAQEISGAQQSLPDHIEDNVYHCGYHAKDSFGATSYLIVRKQGNVLVDSPRFTKSLIQRIEELGGVQTMLLTHKDDVADHEKFHQHFGCTRIIHEKDTNSQTQHLEKLLQGTKKIDLDEDITVIPTPGHTEGHLVFLYKNKFLFTGDHLAYSHRLQHLYAFRSACWYSWEELKKSMALLKDYSFEWVLPGHGRRFHTDSQQMKTELDKCLSWM